MDSCVSGEDLVIKTRKPYKLTKQRERWTEEEHEKFLEALKLYGRTWQRIEEHIGTKTAIQIRSHAQKVFAKLEKEGTVKGSGHALDIEIPPPRPKKKPTNPYPRKTCGGPVQQLGVNTTFVKEPENNEEPQEKDNYIGSLSLDIMAPCTSPTSSHNSSLASDSPKKSFTLFQFVPLMDEPSNQDESAASLVTAKPMGNYSEQADKKHLLTDNNAQDSSVIMDSCVSPDEQASQNYPRHAPMHIFDGSFKRNAHVPSDMAFMQSALNRSGGVHGDQNIFSNTPASATSEYCGNEPTPAIHPEFLNCHPFFSPKMNLEDYQSFLHISSTFSSLILSALAQNAAVYSAASFASSMWPWLSIGAPMEPSKNSSGVPQSRPALNMAAIVGATVAAATAWWTTNGLLPVYPQYHPGSTSAVQMAGSKCENINGEVGEIRGYPTMECRHPDSEFSKGQNPTLKSPTFSSLDTEACAAGKLNVGLNPTGKTEVENADDSNNSKKKNQLDRSSCGSNTNSSSDIEAYAMEMHEKMNEEDHTKTNKDKEEPDAVLPITDLFGKRSRSNSNLNEPRKEVSDEGKLAFHALFSRQVLPQSFPLHDSNNKVNKQCTQPEEDGDDLTTLKLHGKQEVNISSSFNIGTKHNGSLLNERLDLRSYRTGFKLYKRCSLEAKEIGATEDHKDPKRLCLERREVLSLI